ncbi:hypothetical protein HCU64_14210 [Methylobacterium sp. C25]|uniref:hypothetical protein n=1 Tax=Methylobacterium sp. C25 TaxID=2721622 RepID=UPI001F29AF5F|nr:hypothetical protein [Methylobacterium sp. C25]MCE4224913.1 hypothetical protein [Methylobacterium sp. C25]
MARTPTRPVDLDVALQPVASPVDTFVRPQEPSRDTSLQDLARSLSGLGGSLGTMLEERKQKDEQDDKLRGEAAFHQNMGQGFAEGVASGAIPAQYSRTFMQAYKKAQGDVAGADLEQKFSAAYDAWDGKTSTDPKAYDAFVGSFLKDNIGTQDPDILAGLLPRVRQMTSNYLSKHIGDASKATMDGAAATLAARQDQALNDANTVGLASKKGTDYQTTFDTLEAIRAEGLSHGINETEADKKLVDAVTASAVSLRDPKILDFLERKVPGKDYSWANTPYGRDSKQKTIDALLTMGRQSIAEDEKKRREEKAATKDAVTRDTIGWITAHPNEPVPEDLLARGEKVDADFRVNAITWRDKIAKGTATSDPEELLGVTRDVLNGGGLQVVQRAMERGVFKNAGDLTTTWKLAESVAKDGPALEGVLKGGSAKNILDTIRQRTLSAHDLTNTFDPGGLSAEGLQAQQDFKLQILAWRQTHPDANAIEQEKAIGDIGAGILKRIVPPAVGPGTYDRRSFGNPNTYGATGAPEAETQPEAQPGAEPKKNTITRPNPFGGRDAQVPSGLPGAGEDAPKRLDIPTAAPSRQPTSAPPPADAATWYGSLPAETKSIMERLAAEEKKPLSLKVQELYQRGIERGVIQAPTPKPGRQSMRAPDGTPVEAALASSGDVEDLGKAFQGAIDAPASAERVRLMGEAFERALQGSARPIGNYSTAALRDDPKAARILDFISGPESNGNYNAYYGHAGSPLDLSKFSLSQLKSWMGNRGTESSATGRYQFMKSTLFGDPRKAGDSGLVGQMGLSMETRFSPELQDRLAIALLERRGYSKFVRGEISGAKFANNLALEWASLPNITAQNGRPAGVSAYAGDGLNKSLVTPASVLGALGRLIPRRLRPDGNPETRV